MSSLLTAGMFTAFATRPPSSAAATCSATITPARSWASSVDAARCGVSDDVVQLEQRSRVRLAGEDVERGTGDLPGLERLEQRILVDELAARGVDDADAVPGSLERAPVDGRARLVGQRQMQRDDVRRREDGLLRRCSLHAQLPKALSGDERVERDDAHAERQRAARDLLSDPAEAEQPEGLARKLLPGVARALPAACLYGRMGLGDVSPEREQKPDRVLGGRDDGRLRRVDDEDSLPRRGLDVDVVDAHPGAADHAEPLGPLEERSRRASSPSGSRSRRSRR